MDFGAQACTVRLVRCGIGVLTTLIAAVFCVAARWWHLLFLTFAVLSAAGGTALAIWYPPRFAARLQGHFNGRLICAQMGVLIQRTVFVPRSSLRNFEVMAPPLHALFGCRTLLLRFAGGSVVLPFLPKEQALRLVQMMRAEELP